jgi:hypothetical protein
MSGRAGIRRAAQPEDRDAAVARDEADGEHAAGTLFGLVGPCGQAPRTGARNLQFSGPGGRLPGPPLRCASDALLLDHMDCMDHMDKSSS